MDVADPIRAAPRWDFHDFPSGYQIDELRLMAHQNKSLAARSKWQEVPGDRKAWTAAFSARFRDEKRWRRRRLPLVASLVKACGNGEKIMRRIALCTIFAIMAFFNGGLDRAIADDLDTRLADLDKKNLELKKLLRIEALERENLALSQKLKLPVVRDGTQSAAAGVPKERVVYDAMASKHPRTSEPSRHAPQEAQAQQWAGPYFGLNAGIGFGRWPTSISSVSTSSGLLGTTAFNVSDNLTGMGGLAGLQVGYNWQFGSLVFGPEFDLSVSMIGGKKNLPFSHSSIQFGDVSGNSVTSATSLKWLSTLRGRIGVTAGDWMLFGTGGLAAAGLDLESNSGTFFAEAIANGQVAFGYAAGGGLEYALGSNARLRMEYLHFGFPERTAHFQNTYSSTCAACVPPFTSSFVSNTTMSVKPSTNVIRAGVDWKLN